MSSDTPPTLHFFLSEEAKEKGVEFHPPRDGDAGYDVRSAEAVVIPTGEQAMVSTGLHLAVPNGWVALAKDRSSMAAKRIYTHGGVIDSGYRGEVRIMLSNESDESYHIEVGDKITQLVVVHHLVGGVEAESLEQLGETDRGAGGFGSTGR